MGLRLTTKVQVSGWRFLLRRLEHAIVRRDTRMFDDPLQFYSRSAMVGVVIAAMIAVGACAMALFRPQGKLGGGDLYADSGTFQIFVNVTGRLHPVFNLSSARLILGSPANPTVVKSSELSAMTKGAWVGIPGAPHATPVTAGASPWALCDTVTNPDSAAPVLQTSLLSMPLVTDAAMGPIPADTALLASYQGSEWIITPQGRHAVDRANRAITSAVGIPVSAVPVPISGGLYNALPDAGAWQLPPIPGSGEPNTLGLPEELVVGSVFQTYTSAGPQYHVVLLDGVAPVNSTTAAALRATDSHGLVTPPEVVPNLVITLPERPYDSPLPPAALTPLSRQDAPVLCWTWDRRAGDQKPQTVVIAGRHLPIPPSALGSGITQVQGTATVYTNGGKYIQVQSDDPRYGESLYYVDPLGVRYGLPDQETAATLGLSSPTPAPWEVVRLLVEGPVLSRDAALLERDRGVFVDPNPRKLGAS